MTFSSVKNKSLLTGVYMTDSGILMCTNTGEHMINKCRVFLGMKNDPWLDENAMGNIISFSKLIDQYCVTYDSGVSDSFQCHTEYGIT